MTTTTERYQLAAAAESYGVPLPGYVTDAQALLDAATAYKTEVAALTEPDLSAVTPKTIAKTIDAVLAFRDRDERLKLACRVEAIASSSLDWAFQRFKHTLMTDLAAPFDAAAAKFMDARDLYKQQDRKVVETLTDLVRVRDLLAGRVGEGLQSPTMDAPTRIATFASREDIVRRVKSRTQGLERGTQAYLEALLSIPGCRLKWQTPTQQREHIDAIPAGGDSILAHHGGDVA